MTTEAIGDQPPVQDTFAKYRSPEVTEYLLAQEMTGLGGEERDVSILVLGIGNWASVTEGMQPTKIGELLGRHYKGVVPAVLEHYGRIDKYLDGGGMLAVFGAPTPLPNPELSALIVARTLRNKILEFNLEAGNPHFDFRIAVSSGLTATGNIGTEERLDYTVVGEPVTLAHLMIGLARDFRTSILIDENTYQAVASQVSAGEPHIVVPSGLTRPIAFYPIV